MATLQWLLAQIMPTVSSGRPVNPEFLKGHKLL
jgi:hypothetical protein